MSDIPKNEEEMKAMLKHCGFCDMWNQYHKTCSITGDKKKWDNEICDMYKKEESTEKQYRNYIKEATDGHQ